MLGGPRATLHSSFHREFSKPQQQQGALPSASMAAYLERTQRRSPDRYCSTAVPAGMHSPRQLPASKPAPLSCLIASAFAVHCGISDDALFKVCGMHRPATSELVTGPLEGPIPFMAAWSGMAGLAANLSKSTSPLVVPFTMLFLSGQSLLSTLLMQLMVTVGLQRGLYRWKHPIACLTDELSVQRE